MPKDRVEAVDRALTILTAFQEDDQALSLSELAKRTGLYKSTILRLLGSLKAFNFITQDSEGAYNLGPDLWRLGSQYRDRYLPATTVLPVLERLRDKTNETASFYVRDGAYRICLYRMNATRPLRHHLVQGTRLPLEKGAAGRVLLAYDGPPTEDADTVISQGHTLSLGERDPEIAAIAVPVKSKTGPILGALTLSGLVTRFTEENCTVYLEHLMQEAGALQG